MNTFSPPKRTTIGVIGLGYVGLPLAVEFAKKYRVVGFDINEDRIAQLNQGFDSTLEVSENELKEVVAQVEGKKSSENSEDVMESGLLVSNEVEHLKSCNFYIVTVPTPTDKHHRPDLTPLIKASETVGKVLKNKGVVVYESTVYPGATEEECIPILEKFSELKFNENFFAGYSPERINPGDKEHTVSKILKVTSGSTKEVAAYIDGIYKSVITAGTFQAASIKVAEAAKVIENSQRDINIAFVNELAMIFNKLDIDTSEVLEAAGTKWNFLPFKPGLVGGHCIGVDPYYLAQKAEEVGYHPEIILSGRRLNDKMGGYVAGEVIKLMVKKDLKIKGANVLILGITFKENCPDIRNTRVIDIINEMKNYGTEVAVYDPWANPTEVEREYGFQSIIAPPQSLDNYSVIILAVGHKEFMQLDLAQKSQKRVLFDVKGVLDSKIVDGRL